MLLLTLSSFSYLDVQKLTHQIAPPHVACGSAVEGAGLALQAGLFWSNIIPDAVAQVDLSLDGERLSFLGNGYHDKVSFEPPQPAPPLILTFPRRQSWSSAS